MTHPTPANPRKDRVMTCETCTASAFISAIAKRYQERHVPPLSDGDALVMALATLEYAEHNSAPFNTETAEWDWSLDTAVSLADEEIASHWEPAS